MHAIRSHIATLGLGIALAVLTHGRAWGGEGAQPTPPDGEFRVIYGGSNWAVSTSTWRGDQGHLEGQELSPTRVDGLSGFSCTVPVENASWGATKRQFYVLADALCGHDEMRPPNKAAILTVPFHGWRIGAPTPAKRLEEAQRLVDMRKPLEAIPILRGIIEYARQDLPVSEPALTLLVKVFQMAKDAEGVTADYAPVLGRYLTQVPPLDGRSLPDKKALREDLLWKSWRGDASRFHFQVSQDIRHQQYGNGEVVWVYIKGEDDDGRTRIVGAAWQGIRIRTDRDLVEGKLITTTGAKPSGTNELTNSFSLKCMFPWNQDVRIKEIDATVTLTQMATTRKQSIDAVQGQTWQQSSLGAGNGQATVLGILQVGPEWHLMTDEMADNLDVEFNAIGASGKILRSTGSSGAPSSVPNKTRKSRHFSGKPVRLEIVSAAETSTRTVPLHLSDLPIE